MKFFECFESNGKYIICFNARKEMNIKGGSFSVLAARLLGLSYVNYCRMCRDMYGAEIRGKDGMYCTIYFSKENAEKLSEELNKRFCEYVEVDLLE